MFLVLSKVLDLLLSPLTWVLLLGVGGLVLRRWRRLSLASQLLSLAVLYAFSIEPTVALLTRATEADAVSTYRPDTVYDAVILLGGGLDAAATERSGALNQSTDMLRELAGRLVYRLRGWTAPWR